MLKRMQIYLFFLGIIFSLYLSFQVVSASGLKLHLKQVEEQTRQANEAIVQLNVQRSIETVNVSLSKGMHIDIEKTLLKNIGEIESIKEINEGFKMTFVNTQNRNEKINLYLKTDKNVKQGTIKAEQNKMIYSNKLEVSLPEIDSATKQVQLTGPLVKEDEQWEEVTKNPAKITVGDIDIYSTIGGGGYSSDRPKIRVTNDRYYLSISGDLIINDKMLQVDNTASLNSDPKVDMFNSRRKTKQKFYINSKKNKWLMQFTLDSKYEIQILMYPKTTGDIDKTYAITNKSGSAIKIGISELFHVQKPYSAVNIFVPYSSDLISVKRSISSDSQLVQWSQGDFQNWSYGLDASNFKEYTSKNAFGTGVEQLDAQLDKKGKWRTYASATGEVQVSGKTLGRQVENGETIKFSNKMYIASTPPPILTLSGTEFTVGHGSAVVQLNGTVYDKTRNAYQLMYYDETDKKLMMIKSFNEKPGVKVNLDGLEADLGELSSGNHIGNFYLINDVGLGSNRVSVKIKVLSVGGKAVIQKVQVGDSFEKKLEELVTNISGDQVTMTQLKKPDTSKIGYSKATATLQDSLEQKIDIDIPVNVYEKNSTTFYDKEEIAVDGKQEVAITVVELQLSENWDKLIKDKAQPQAWDMRTGEKFTPNLKENNLQNTPGSYKALFSVDKPKQPIIHDVILQVTGFLEFKQVPNFDFGTVKIPEKATMISRAGKEQIIINDERGPNKNWRLTAMLTQETQTSKQKRGNLVFVHENGQAEVMTPAKLIVVKTGKTEKESLQPLEWKKDTGLLFRVSPESYFGNYIGNISWVLEDVPNDE
ncbi:WxL domain-containing protein [Candidatus Enterococcus mansonii]|uniref:WxL domain-containing protein n=1 Tax=Candidatus Enterococcus mansonii TaxID=1834181 RepID=A0A242CFD0_9ENTE|nr:WxL domain-containing protein [Enterococcus sp. 4G2_DIV0659]OTO08964.1 hypothetical protein A5880_001964 [Enterococcus sp. 4G2_DIV0659]